MGFLGNKTRITDSAVLWEIDLADKIRQLSNGDIQISEKWTVSMTVEADVRNKIDQKGLVDVFQEMVDDAQKAGDNAAREIVSTWRSYANRGSGHRLSADEQIRVMERKVHRRKRFNQKSEGIIKRLKSELGEIPHKRWEKFKQIKKDYRNYKIKAGFKVGATTAGIGIAIGSTAASVPTGGASIALTAIGLQRSVFSLVEQLRDLHYEGEQVLQNLVSDIESLERTSGHDNHNNQHSQHGHRHHRRHRHHKKGALRARELGSNMAQAVSGVSPLASIKRCTNNFDLLKNKTNGVIRKSNQLASKINELLEATEKLNANLATRSFSPDRKRKVEKMVVANETAIHSTITKCIETRERWTTLSQKLPQLNKRIEDLRQIAGKNVVKAMAFIPVLTDIGLAGWGAGDGFSGVEKAWEYATNSITSTMDLVSASTDVYETATG